MIVLNPVKADKVAQFEEFNQKYLSPAGAEVTPDARKTVRIQKPAGQNKDGTFTYVYLMDPYVENYNYDIYNILETKFGKEKGEEYFKMFTDCLKDGKTQSYQLIETDW